jgi:polyhydroxyalkanoate synthesis regulator phasin
MPAPRFTSAGRPGGAGSGKPTTKRSSAGTSKRSGSSNRSGATKRSGTRSSSKSVASSATVQAANLGEQLANSIIKPLDLVLISRERIQQTLDEAAERGRVTRADANELVVELVRRGRQQTDDLLADLERRLGRGRDQLGSAGKRVRTAEPVDRIVRGADRARRTMGVGPTFPILSYDDLTAGQVLQRLSGLSPADLRKVRDYERRHANRKTVLEAIERALG